LKQALLGGLNNGESAEGDVEAPPAKKSRSWYSLFGTALVFVWPDDWVLQVCGASSACLFTSFAGQMVTIRWSQQPDRDLQPACWSVQHKDREVAASSVGLCTPVRLCWLIWRCSVNRRGASRAWSLSSSSAC